MQIEIILQLLFNSVAAAALILLVAYGFSMIFHTLKVFHIAHGAFIVLAPYFFIVISDWLSASGFQLALLFLISIAATSVLAVFIEKVVYRPMFKKGSSEITSFIASLGLYLFLINGIALFKGHRMKILSSELRTTFDVGYLLVTDIQIIQILIAFVCISLITFWLHSSGRKKIFDAIADNPRIAMIIGLPVRFSRLVAIVVGTALASVAGLLMGFDTGINPHSGMSITLTSIVVVLIAGKRDLYILILVSLLVGFLQQASSWYLSSAWADGLTFALLLGVLLLRTEGVLSYQLRKDHLA